MEQKQEEQSVFRQTSLDRISSPEQTDDYLCLPTPNLLLFVAAGILLGFGALIWILCSLVVEMI